MIEQRRIAYLDALRVISMVAVMALHVASTDFYQLEGNSPQWMVINFYNSIVHFGVPIFFMISGALFLPRDIPIKVLWKKYILRIAVAYFAWAFFYALLMPNGILFYVEGAKIYPRGILINSLKGIFHMWFMPAIIGVYAMIPFLKQFVKSKKITEYFLLLSFIFEFCIPFAVQVVNDYCSGFFVEIVNAGVVFFDRMNMRILFGFFFYFVLGYVLSQRDFSKKQRYIIYSFGILGFVMTFALNQGVAMKTNIPCENYYNRISLNICMEAVAIFTFFKYLKYPHEKWNRFVAKLGKYSFGAYLCHILFREIIVSLGYNTLTFSPWISVPLFSLVVVLCSMTVSAIINHIPILKKWIV